MPARQRCLRPTAFKKCTTLGLIRTGKIIACYAISYFLFWLFWFAHRVLDAQRGGGVKWAKDGKGYYAVESNSLVRYDLPRFTRVVIADAAQLTPAGRISRLRCRLSPAATMKRNGCCLPTVKRYGGSIPGVITGCWT